MSLFNITGLPLGLQSGQITFDVSPDATGDDFSDLNLNLISVNPNTVDVSALSGFIDVEWGQTASLGIDERFAVVGADEYVEVDWVLVAGSGLRELELDLIYDPDVVSPRVVDDTLSGCLDAVDVTVAECSILEPGRMRISLTQPGENFGNQGGRLVFDLNPLAGGDDFSPLDWEVASSFPMAAPIEIDNGFIDLLWGPPAQLRLGTEEVERGQGRVTLEWSLLPEDNGLVEIAFEIEFDDTHLDIQVDSNGVPVGCLESLIGETTGSCTLVDASTVQVVLTAGLAGSEEQAGQLQFELADTVPVDQFIPVRVRVIETSPSNAPVERVQGGFAVIRAQPDRLVFEASPGRGVEQAELAPMTVVHVVDSYGLLVDNDDATVVTLELLGADGVAELQGQLSRVVEGGVASFPSLSVDRTVMGVELRATDASGQLDFADSEPFDVWPDPIFQDRWQPEPVD